jgi:hypothetical protein
MKTSVLGGLCAIVLFFGVALRADAHIPVVIEQATLHDITLITDPVLSEAFYGRLQDMPHTYEMRLRDPIDFKMEILLPDIEGVSKDISAIVIEETGNRGQVREVTRLLGRNATWDPFFEPWGGDRYLKGGEFSAHLEPGVYRIEMSTPDNNAPYVLVVGTNETWGDIGYFEMVHRIASVKNFFGKSELLVIESPLVYVPLLILCLLLFMLYRKYVRTRRVI